MLLAIDIGNTDSVFALHDQVKWCSIWRIKSDPSQLPGFYALRVKNHFLENNLSLNKVNRVIISSVVPGLLNVIVPMVELVFSIQPVILGPKVYPKLPVSTSNPKEIGSDLMANACAAYSRTGSHCLVIDFGTALTFTTINADGTIEGVAIAPGIRTAMKSLSGNTAQLPEIELSLPDSVLGKHTIHAMQAGILIGYIGLVEKMIAQIEKEIDLKPYIIATGGLSHVLTPLHEHFDELDKNLTLEGLLVASDILSKLEN